MSHLHDKQDHGVSQAVDKLVAVVSASLRRQRRRRHRERRLDERRGGADGEKLLAQERDLNPEHEDKEQGLNPAADVTCKQ